MPDGTLQELSERPDYLKGCALDGRSSGRVLLWMGALGLKLDTAQTLVPRHGWTDNPERRRCVYPLTLILLLGSHQ